MSKVLLLMFSSRIFMVLSLTCKSLIHFIFFFCVVLEGSNFISAHYPSNFPNTIYWIDILYPIIHFCLLCQILIEHKGLFMGSLFCSLIYMSVFMPERESLMWERNINWLLPICNRTGDQTCSLGMCPDREWSPQPFGVQEDAPTNPTTRPGQSYQIFN